jgi:glycosyltransferase involved in cell wall biosynthesis
MTYPKISIAMATYNGARFIREQLDSLAAQTRLPYELIACDDGSTDSTLAILEDFAAMAPFPVRIYRNPERLGHADNFLKAASLCEGEWIAFCDQDDGWLPQKLEVVADAIRRHPEIVLVSHPAEFADEALRPTGQIAWPSPERLYRRLSRPWRGGMGCGQVFRSSLVRDIPYERRFIMGISSGEAASHDYWIAKLAQCVGSSYYLSRPLILRRRHEDCLTWNSPTWNKTPTSSGSRWLAWLRWHDITDKLLTQSRLAKIQSEVLGRCAVEASPSYSATLQDASHYFADAARVLRARSECRRLRGVHRYAQALRLLAMPAYWRMGRGIVGWRERVRDMVELFGMKASQTVANADAIPKRDSR